MGDVPDSRREAIALVDFFILPKLTLGVIYSFLVLKDAFLRGEDFSGIVRRPADAEVV